MAPGDNGVINVRFVDEDEVVYERPMQPGQWIDVEFQRPDGSWHSQAWFYMLGGRESVWSSWEIADDKVTKPSEVPPEIAEQLTKARKSREKSAV
jgi:hypothetical protein